MRTRFIACALTLLVTTALAASVATASPQTLPSAAVQLPDNMAQYYMVFLRRGPAWTAAVTPETTALGRAHQANIQRLTAEGTMVVAGPFLDQTGDRALAGLFLLRAASIESAREIADSDPAVKAGRFVYEIAPWLGPKGLRY